MKIYIPNETTSNSVGANHINEIISNLEGIENIELIRNGSWGAFWLEPFIEVERDGNRVGTCYKDIDLSHLRTIEDFLGDFDSREPFDISEIDFIKKQKRIVFSRIGLGDPLDINLYKENGGFNSLTKALSLDSQKVIDKIKESGLTGRGGAAFPTGIKMQTVHDQNSPIKYLACNADEGDGGTFSDRLIMESDPFALIEGMTIAAYAVGASKGYLYLRSEYPLAKKFLENAIAIANENNLLGNSILSSNFDFEIDLRIGAGSYVCGEETAMMESIEGRRGLVRSKPPLPAINGLFNKPTLINNVVTLATIPPLLNGSLSDFSGMGSGKSIGTMPFQLCGNILQSGLVETGFDISIGEMIESFGKQTKSGKPIHAIQIGGPLGMYLSSEMMSTKLTIESLQSIKGSVGHGGIVIFDDTVDMSEQAKFAMEFCSKESCGKCTPCRIGSIRGVEIIERLQKDKSSQTYIGLLHDLCQTMEATSLCAMGGMTPNPIYSIINNFPGELTKE
tara:strand:+ start:549 stop:2069 length:1521 start_codon:yes stop_codon:yes gene_type:complete